MQAHHLTQCLIMKGKPLVKRTLCLGLSWQRARQDGRNMWSLPLPQGVLPATGLPVAQGAPNPLEGQILQRPKQASCNLHLSSHYSARTTMRTWQHHSAGLFPGLPSHLLIQLNWGLPIAFCYMLIYARCFLQVSIAYPQHFLNRPGGDVAGHQFGGAHAAAQRVMHRAAPAACHFPCGCRRGHL